MIKRLISMTLSVLLLSGTAYAVQSCKTEEPVEKPVDPTPEPDPEPEPEPTPDSGDFDKVPEGFVEEPDATVANPAGTADLAALEKMGHPRVLMNRADFDRLKEKALNNRFQNKTLYKLHKLLMDVANESVADNTQIVYQLDAAGKRILDKSQLALKRIGSCAYAYRMTGQSRYLEKAVSDMKTVIAFKDWNQSRHFLDTSEMAFAVALGYDWLYYSLDYDLRVSARKALLNNDITNARSHWSNTSAGNWNQVCYGGSIAAAIAIYGKEKSASGGLLNDCIKNNGDMVKAIYDPDGVYPEGYSYWGYGTGYQGVIFTLLENSFGQLFGMDASAGLAKTPQWMLMMTGIGNRTYCYGDSTGSYAVPKMGMWWFAKHYTNTALLKNEMALLNGGGYTTACDEIRLLPMAIACANDIENLDTVSEGENVNLYSGGGEVPVVLMRTDWTNSDTDRYLGLKGGQANSSHGHMDAGSFVYDALGLRWSEDVQRESYARVENALKAAGGSFWNMGQNSLRWQVWRLNNRAHSTLTVNDSDHLVKKAATVVEASGTTAVLDLTGPLSKQVESARRTFKIVDGELYVIDEITAKANLDAAVEWRMMTPATVSVGSDAETLTQKGKTMYLKATSSDSSVPVSYTTWAAKGSNSWDTPCTGYTVAGFTATVPKGTTVTFTTKLTPSL